MREYLTQKIRSIRCFFETAEGDIVIGQTPNWPMITAVLLYASRFAIDLPVWQLVSNWGTQLLLLYWAYLEIVAGVNSWRKTLGWVVAALSVASMITLFIRMIGIW